MHFSTSFLTLPTSLLLFIANGRQAQAIQGGQPPAKWPQNLPREVKFWPEDPPNRRRDVEAKKHLLEEGLAPIGVRKMSSDPNEKFYPEYWAFEEEDMHQAVIGIGSSWALRQGYHEEEKELYDNGTVSLSFRPPFPFHTDKEDSLSRRDVFKSAKDWMDGKGAAGTLALLKKRDFKCVTGTNACVNINQPNLCCATGETCYSIPDTGLGTVGCCPSGQTCGGSIICASGNLPCLVNNTSGYTGGGCCIPGWVCAGVGCVPQVSVISSTQTTVIAPSSTAVVVVTKTVSPSFTPPISTTTETACPTSQFPCPVSLGGGCCPSGQICQVGSCPATTSTTTITSSAAPATTSTSTTTAAGVVPIRGTTVSSSTTSTTTSNSLCPTGFYACSATYGGGCCQTGRDCHTTSCPAVASTTIVSSGVTIVVPLTPAATTTASGSCAAGWSSCAPSLGGACCLSGWACGTVSCFSSVGPSQSVAQAKGGVVLNRGVRVRGCLGVLVGAVGVVFVGMIIA